MSKARSRKKVESDLRKLSSKIPKTKQALDVAIHARNDFQDAYEDASLRAMVSENPADRKEATAAERHAKKHQKLVQNLTNALQALERRQDELLDELNSAL